jgi:maleylacetate reductase
MALHHKLCHTLGGSFDLPHAETHAAVLQRAAAYNASAVPEAMRVIVEVLGTGDAPRGLYDLGSRLGAKMALKDLGLPEDGIDRATEAALSNPYWNPRPLERSTIRDLIARAYAGEPP